MLQAAVFWGLTKHTVLSTRNNTLGAIRDIPSKTSSACAIDDERSPRGEPRT